MKLVYGFGINDANYVVSPFIDGRQVVCPAYKAWRNMLARCYGRRYQDRNPTYTGVVVCDEWRRFANFREWWVVNAVDCWSMDKDLIGCGKLYSPENCIFVPQWLNSFTVDASAARGDFPIGAYRYKSTGRFSAKCCNPHTKKQEYLGLFDGANEAHECWKNKKIEFADALKPDMDAIDARIYRRIIEIIKLAI